MNSRLIELKSKLDRLSGAKKELEFQLKQIKSRRKKTRIELRNAKKARTLIQLAAKNTQDQLEYQITELPNLALSSVFEDPYKLELDFLPRRGKMEVDFHFVREGEKTNPKESCGLGAVDIAGMALRPALWSLQNPKTRDCIWLDEPFKHLKGEVANSRALSILSEICKPRPDQNWPGLQIIMIADERASREELLEVADCVYEFSMKGRRTITRKLK